MIRRFCSPLHIFLRLLCIGFAPLALKAAETAKGSRVISLDEAYDLALATDQSIRIAYWQVRQANLLPWSALTRLGPQLSGSVGYARTEKSAEGNGIETITTTTSVGTSSVERTIFTRTNASDASITFQQPLVDLTVFPAYRLGKLSASAAKLTQQYTVRETLFGVVTAYYEVLKQQRLVDVDRETLRLNNEQLDLAQKRANVGEVTRADVLRAQVTVETAREAQVSDEGQLDLDRNTLANILNLPPNSPYLVSEPPDYPSLLPSFDDLLQRAYTHREDLQVKQLAISQDTERRNAVVGQYWPKVVAGLDAALGHDSGSAPSTDHNWEASVSVQVPFLTGGQREIDLRTATEQIEVTKLDRDRTAKTVEADVKMAWLAVRDLPQTLKALHAQVVAAEQGSHDLENQYRAGTATSVDVLSALNDLNLARKNLAFQTYAYQVALRSVEQATGVFQEPRVQRSKFR